MKPSYDRIPERMREPAREYVEEGERPGPFLQRVLEDSLTGAYGRADHGNRKRLGDWVTWLYNDIPGNCWGSKELVDKWVEKGGLNGDG